MSTSINTTTPMMSSKEISELLGSRHDKVKQSIERLAAKSVIALPPVREVVNKQSLSANNTSKVYVFEGEEGKRDSYIVVAQLSPEFTARLVDRWQELESEAANLQPQLPDFNNPAEAARAWADQFEGREEAEALALEHQKKIEEDAPKVDYYQSVGNASGFMTVGEAVKSMNIDGLGRNKAMALLRSIGVLQSSNTYWNQPYQQYINQGYFQMKQKLIPTGQIVPTTLVTTKGHQWLYKKLTQ